ncbi:hypothetical protein [Alsobacter sp. R-9]
MLFFLNAVAALLVIGGGALALWGADNIRSESGTMFALTGVSTTTAGLLLLGLTRMLSELRRIRVLIEDGALRPATPPAAPAAVETAPSPEPVPPPTPAPPGAIAASAATAAGAAVAGGLAAQLLQRSRRRMEEEREALADETPATEEPSDKSGPEPVSAPEPVEPAASARRAEVDSEDDGLLAPETLAEFEATPPARTAAPDTTVSEEADDRSFDSFLEETAREARVEEAGEDALLAAAGDAAPAEPAAEAPPARSERVLAATYRSGDNTYFMYSDGTIEAETPVGRFRFHSMEELRVFVERGEGGIPLAPPGPPGAA